MAKSDKLCEVLGMDHIPERSEIAELTKNPLELRVISLAAEGWKLVPICYASDYQGAPCRHPFREFLPLDRLGFIPTLQFDAILPRTIEGLEFNYENNFVCYLADDWQVSTIFIKAKKRPGCQHVARQHRSIAEIVLKSIYTLEQVFLEAHPGACCRMMADFWRSYQVRKFVADFCRSLGTSETAAHLTGNAFDARDEAERARAEMFRKLSEFADAENHPSVPEQTVAPALSEPAATSSAELETQQQRATRRQAVVMPILRSKGWKRGTLVSKAGIGKNSVYEYLNGTRKSITEANKQAIADALGLQKERLPE